MKLVSVMVNMESDKVWTGTQFVKCRNCNIVLQSRYTCKYFRVDTTLRAHNWAINMTVSV